MKNKKTGNEQVDLILGEKEYYTTPKKSQDGPATSGQDTWYYLGFVGDIGFTIAIPIAGGAILGQYIDKTWNIYPRATLSLLLVGIIISIIGFIHTVMEIISGKKRKN
jgi:predicted F0F1-ATPase subunit